MNAPLVLSPGALAAIDKAVAGAIAARWQA